MSDSTTKTGFESTSPKPPIEDREIKNLPLAPVTFDLPLAEDEIVEGAPWPPERYLARNKRLGLYDEVWRGDLTWINQTVKVSDNVARRAGLMLAQILLVVPPRFDEAGMDEQVSELSEDDETLLQQVRATAMHLMVDELKYGGAIYLANNSPADTVHSVVHPAYWYPSDLPMLDWLVTPVTTSASKTGRPNRLRVRRIDQGVVTESLYEWEQTVSGRQTIGSVIYADDPLGPGLLQRVLRQPEEGHWGTSYLDDLIGPMAARSRGLTRHESILEEHEDPMLVVSTDPGSEEWGGDPDDPYGDTNRKAIQKQMQAWRDHRIVWQPGAQLNASYITWDGQLGASFAQLEELANVLSATTGIPRILASDMGVPSGTALRRLLLPLYAATIDLQDRTRLALKRGLGVTHPTLTMTWPHALDALDEQAMQQAMSMRTPRDQADDDMMEDEDGD